VRRLSARLAVALAVGAAAPAPHADPISVVNALRASGCGREQGTDVRVRPSSELNDAARELSRRNDLGRALSRAGYSASTSTSFHVAGGVDDATIERMLGERYCASLVDAGKTELGWFTKGSEIWIVLAGRLARPPPLDPTAVAWRVLALVNEARSAARDCGRDHFAATTPLALSPTLNDVALAHARDMAEHRVLTHEGSDGSTSGERIARAGYLWRAAGENVASGQQDADAVMASWLASPGHCATLMGPYFEEMGVAFALVPGANPSIYWAQEFAAPR
jgi:Cysteine-rich secretory protein family